ncbi:MAG: cytochrome c3 family protein [Desulfobacteraceae bacterium]|nr:cytochrome c3 family protein [Desulfobacteraceae bacterium]
MRYKDTLLPRIGKPVGFLLILLAISAARVSALTNDDCLGCHGDKSMTTQHDGKTISLYIDGDAFKKTVHADNGCLSCHVDADVKGDEHPVPLKPVDCAACHDKIGERYAKSAHGVAMAKGDKFAPRCYDCHSKHDILKPTDPKSTTYPLNIPYTCGRCHQEGSKMTETHDLNKHNITTNYSMSVHGKGLFEDGLIVTAVCSSCHTAHDVQKASDPASSVNRNNIIKTCSKCHVGIAEQFQKSVHSPLVTKTNKKLPVCTDCHTDHSIARVNQRDFRLIIARQCGNCHEHKTETYMETYHGRASLLKGGERTAKCSDCHGSHNIMPAQDPSSTINTANIVKTCSKCHPNANQSFTTYLTHATHSSADKDKYPYLFYTFWAMTGLLVGTFAFFGLHTILWVPRSIIERLKAMTKQHPH